jgi:hypothetical protein
MEEREQESRIAVTGNTFRGNRHPRMMPGTIRQEKRADMLHELESRRAEWKETDKRKKKPKEKEKTRAPTRHAPILLPDCLCPPTEGYLSAWVGTSACVQVVRTAGRDRYRQGTYVEFIKNI